MSGHFLRQDLILLVVGSQPRAVVKVSQFELLNSYVVHHHDEIVAGPIIDVNPLFAPSQYGSLLVASQPNKLAEHAGDQKDEKGHQKGRYGSGHRQWVVQPLVPILRVWPPELRETLITLLFEVVNALCVVPRPLKQECPCQRIQ